MKFVDYVKVNVRAGDGGKGCCSFRREKFVPRGGPNGGDGGDGGDVIIRGTPHKSTLLDLQFRQHVKAGRGSNGMGKDRHGRKGATGEIVVPLGTVVRDSESGEVLLEVITEEPQVLLHGGLGGRGNAHFKTSTNRAPRQFEPGTPGEDRWIVMELKLMADVGLVGLPNAGKSTLISRISQARPKIADYPFTTLVPNLGVVQDDGFYTFVVADIPGIIRGAHDGAGLGHRFLRHIERTALLLLMIDVAGLEGSPPMDQYHVLMEEMEAYDAGLLDKPRAVALTKIDLLPQGAVPLSLLADLSKLEPHVYPVSAVSGQGVQALIRFLGEAVRQVRTAAQAGPGTARVSSAPSH